MSDNDFRSLSPREFERLVRDALNVEWGLNLQRFGPGPDQGRDLLSDDTDSGLVIVQCKHYPDPDADRLKRVIKDEASKVAVHSPDRYIIATSMQLTPKARESIALAASPYCRTWKDVIAKEWINDVINSNPEIELRHPKIWMGSASSLQNVLHRESILWNRMTQYEIESQSKMYVETGALQDIVSVLEKQGACIVSGAPGVGKTTVARVAVSYYLKSGFELISIRSNPAEALKFIDPDRKQIIYYDDFLGDVFYDPSKPSAEDRVLIRLMNMAKSSLGKMKIVCTTREYILQSARLNSEELARHDVDSKKITVEVTQQDRSARAEILYNHLYFSDLPQQCLDAMVDTGTYLTVINHKNYTPRVIESIVSFDTSRRCDEYPNYALQMLDQPEKIWEIPFKNRIGESERLLLYALYSFGDQVAVEDLRSAWDGLTDRAGLSFVGLDRSDHFDRAIALLNGSFVVVSRIGDKDFVDFGNPSIKQYVGGVVYQRPDTLSVLVTCSRFFEQLEYLFSLGSRHHFGWGGRVAVDRAVANAVKRVLGARACCRVASVSLGEGRRYHRPAVHLARRLARIAAWADYAKSELLLAVAEDEVCRVHENGEDSQLVTSSILEFIDRWSSLRGARCEEFEVGAKIKDILEQFAEEEMADSVDLADWKRFATIAARVPYFFIDMDVPSLKREFENILFNFTSMIISDGSLDAAEATERLDEAKEIADLLHVDIADDEPEILEAIRDLEEQEFQNSLYQGKLIRENGGGTFLGGSSEIRGMFLALKSRDRRKSR